MSQLLAPTQSDSSPSRVSHFLPTVKCSSCSQPVPLSSLGAHVCSSQQPPPLSSKQTQPPLRQLLVPPQESRPRSNSQSVPRSSPMSNATSHVPFPTISTPPPRPEDYMPGGESGMAGVGRRAFQAAAHAAIFAQHKQIHQYPYNPQLSLGIQGNEYKPPQFLDIAGSSGRGTPPLSPNSTQSSPRSHSPLSPLSQSPISIVPAVAASRTPSPGLNTSMSSSRSYSNTSRTPPSQNTPNPDTTSSRLPFFQKYKNTLDQTPPGSAKVNTFYDSSTNSIPPRSSVDSNYSGNGLAYDNSELDEEEVVGRLSLDHDRTSSSSRSAYSAASVACVTRDDLPGASPRRSHTTPTVGPRGGPGGVASPLGSVSPPGAGAARSASDARNVRRAKGKDHPPRPRVCIRCEINIENGRWIKMDAGKGVLCERCWKNMYLPKCRRCDKPIEQAAVYSSDGQLKGKYHRECFNCATCHKPFPDKSFYVYDGHPMCAFHYHQANGSLCVSSHCGKPIEGACAITFVGDRYHPNCLRCGYVGCDERLEDYWEVDGMMLCERHAQRLEQDVDSDDDVGELGRIASLRRPAGLGSGEARAQKRTTRLINLAGAF